MRNAPAAAINLILLAACGYESGDPASISPMTPSGCDAVYSLSLNNFDGRAYNVEIQWHDGAGALHRIRVAELQSNARRSVTNVPVAAGIPFVLVLRDKGGQFRDAVALPALSGCDAFPASLAVSGGFFLLPSSRAPGQAPGAY